MEKKKGELKIRGEIEAIQTTALLNLARMLRRVISYAAFLSLDVAQGRMNGEPN